MPTIMPIRDLRNTSEISKLAHEKNEPIFITKNGYSDLVIMSIETYERNEETKRIEEAICEGELELQNGSKGTSAREVMERLNKKYYGKI